MKTGLELIALERQRQIEELGYNQNFDTQHELNDLAYLAASYALGEDAHKLEAVYIKDADGEYHRQFGEGTLVNLNIFDVDFDEDDRKTQLVKAGALIAAELDKLIAETQTELNEKDNRLNEIRTWLTNNNLPFEDNDTHLVISGEKFNTSTLELWIHFGIAFLFAGTQEFTYVLRSSLLSEQDDVIVWVRGADSKYDTIKNELNQAKLTSVN